MLATRDLRTWRAPWLLAAGLALALLSPLAPAAQDAAQFEQELSDARAPLRRRKWKEADAAIRALLVEHAGAEYARPHVQALREDLRRANFWMEVDEPEAEELISGRLLRYSPSSGSVRLRYTREDLGDFEKHGPTYAHPMHFSAKWSLEIEGTPDEVSELSLFVELEPGDGYMFAFGKREKGDFIYTQHVAERLEGPKRTRLGVADLEERKSKRKTVKGKLSVNRRAIQMSYDGKRVLEVDMPEEDYGSLVLVGSSDAGLTKPFGQITIDGQIDGGWIGGLMDAAVSAQRAEFDARWQDPPVFEAWALEDDGSEELSWEQLFRRLKFPLEFETPAQKDLFERVQQSFERGPRQAAATLTQMEGWPERAMPPAPLAYLKLNCALILRRSTLALEALAALEAPEGQAVELELFRASLLLESGRHEEALAAFERLAEEDPGLSLAQEQAAEALLLMGRADDAHALILRGLAARPSSAALRRREEQIVKAARGPAWERVVDEPGQHFRLRTDAGRKLARETRKELDRTWDRAAQFFGPLPEGALEHARATAPRGEGEEKPPHSVAYLFSGEGSYLDYVRGIADAGHENTLGIYSPLLKQIAAWNQPDKGELFDTLRHEVAHRYLDLQLGERIPRWLNEGLAECFAACWNSEGRYAPGGMRDHALASFLLGAKPVALVSFLELDEEAFVAMEETGYAQAWALTHFLRFGKAEERAVHDRILAELAAGTDPSLAIERALEGVDVGALHERFFAWLNEAVQQFQRER